MAHPGSKVEMTYIFNILPAVDEEATDGAGADFLDDFPPPTKTKICS